MIVEIFAVVQSYQGAVCGDARVVIDRGGGAVQGEVGTALPTNGEACNLGTELEW